MKSTFASLKFFNYRVWFICAIIVNVGAWMQRIAQDWLVLTELTHDSGFAVGIVTALQFGPFLFLSPLAGLLADRLPRRTLLFFTQAGQGLLAIGLGVLVLSGHVQLWHVYVFAALLGVVSTLEGPVRQTFVNELVPQGFLTNAVGLNSASFNVARMIGPAIAGVLIALVGTGPVFIINGVSFAASIIALALMRQGELQVLPKVERCKGQIRQAVAYVTHRSDLIVVFTIAGIISCFGMNFQLTSGVMARVAFDQGSGQYGLLGSVVAIGAVVGALFAARRKRPRVRWVIGSAFAFGFAQVLAALAPSYLWYALSGIPYGLAMLTLVTAAQSTVQLSCAPELRGRVMSLYMMVFQGTALFGSPFIGWVAEQAGPRWSIGVGAVAAFAVATWAFIWSKRRWNVELHYSRAAHPRLTISHDAEQAPVAA